MRSFKDKFPNLSDDKLLIKKKLWEREQDERIKLIESLRTMDLVKKMRKILDDGDDDLGSYFDFPGWDNGGIVSDPPIAGARLEFYRADGSIAIGETDENGRFTLPPLFYSGFIIAKGGIDTVNGLEFKFVVILPSPINAVLLSRVTTVELFANTSYESFIKSNVNVGYTVVFETDRTTLFCSELILIISPAATLAAVDPLIVALFVV
jgi:hypothetical protein